jgi:hypothetical protein
MTSRRGPEDGFALLDVLIACGMLVGIAAGVASAAAVAIRTGAESRVRTSATVLAAQKMEQLRSLAWSEAVDTATGARFAVSDTTTDLSVDPAADSGAGLAPSPAGTLDANVPPYVDHLDAAGAWVGRGTTSPPAAMFTRRWSIRPLDVDPADTVIVSVRVVPVSRAGDPPAAAGRRRGDDVRLVSIRSRVRQ